MRQAPQIACECRNGHLPQEEGQIMASDRSSCLTNNPPATTAMRSAIAFGLLIVILGIFLPGVIHAMDVFLLVLFDRATSLVQALPPATSQPAMMSNNYPLTPQ